MFGNWRQRVVQVALYENYWIMSKYFICLCNTIKWHKVFKNESSEIYGRLPLKNLKWYGLLKDMFFWMHEI